MIPQNIKEYLTQVFTSVGFSKGEIEEKLTTLDTAFTVAIFCKMIGDIPEKQQKPLGEKIKQAKTAKEAIELLTSYFQGNIDEGKLRKVYTEELKKIVNKMIEPFYQRCTSQQLKVLSEITSAYISST